MFFQVYGLYSITRAEDSKGGGYAEALVLTRNIWGAVTIHDAQAIFVCDARETGIDPEMRLVLGGEQYRIMGAALVPVSHNKAYSIEKVEAPVAVMP